MTWIASDDIEPIVVLALNDLGSPIVGKTDIFLRVQRRHDDRYLDWSDNTFKPAISVVTMDVQLEEVNSSYSPGEYRLNYNTHIKGFNAASVVNVEDEDIYFFLALQTPGVDVVNLPQTGQIRVGGTLEDTAVDKTPFSL